MPKPTFSGLQKFMKDLQQSKDHLVKKNDRTFVRTVGFAVFSFLALLLLLSPFSIVFPKTQLCNQGSYENEQSTRHWRGRKSLEFLRKPHLREWSLSHESGHSLNSSVLKAYLYFTWLWACVYNLISRMWQLCNITAASSDNQSWG